MADMHSDTPLEPDGDALRDLVDRAMDRIVRHLETLGDQPASRIEGSAELSRSLVEPLPETATPFDELLDLLFERVMPYGFNTAGPGFMAFIPGGGLPHSALADLIAGSINRYVGAWQPAPGFAQLEQNVIRWFCDMVGFASADGAEPSETPRPGGFLSSGGSIANLTAVVTARRDRLPEDFSSGILYTSDQVHHSVTRAAVVAGFPARNVRAIPVDREFRLRGDALEEAIHDDRRDDLTPFLLVANAGSTNTGAVDDLVGLARLARRENLWFHVDAAYGGFFLLTERGRALLAGIERADSVTLDPHKGLFLPYGTGCLLVRDATTLLRAHSVHADYMPEIQQDAELVDFCEVSPELSRDFRGLRVWLPFKLHGIEPFRRQLDEKIDLALWATAELETIAGIEILARPRLSLVAFALSPPGVEGEALDRLNRDFLERINSGGRVFLTGTRLHDRFALRICVLSFRTHRERVAIALEDIRQSAAALLPSGVAVG